MKTQEAATDADRYAAFDRSLGGLITKVSHLTVNVSDLDRAVDFYERTYPVHRAEVIEPEAQELRGLGIERGRFRARMMRDTSSLEGRGILLVQWLDPAPVGVPYASANHAGYYRMHANASRSGQWARHALVTDAGGRPYGEPSEIEIAPGYRINSFAFRDPDGTTLEWIGPLDPNDDAPADFLTAYNANITDLPASHAWYRRVLGLHYQARLNAPDLQPASNGSLGDLTQNRDGSAFLGSTHFDATILSPWGDPRNAVDLLEWTSPPTYGRPYASPTNLGTQSVTYLVTDADHAYAKLLDLLDEPGAHLLHGPEDWDLGELGVRRVLNMTDPDGLRIQFLQVPGAPAPADPTATQAPGAHADREAPEFPGAPDAVGARA